MDNSNNKYIDLNTVAKAKGLKSTRALRIAIQKGKYIARENYCYPHLIDRVYKIMKFEQFNLEDIREIIMQLSDLS